ncbi:Serine O-acetyltransferase [Hymenobacter roseosalivarius DSM 11622]|uniref:Serine O-acetyltransferase n=1 Tax=Hymenobacter roseosalivarius DSM 11622 TaxID=645990 RepID=A0A1W1V8H1_9BACT|nr:serine O-acetyltransferase [Hymenobacter roseosalivarius]SMB89331.1 Serine O-acetyltransferase [Hymenobacter roseosalivarius DSM 11622]
MSEEFVQTLALAHHQAPVPLPAHAFCHWADNLLALLFPERADRQLSGADAVAATLSQLRANLIALLRPVLTLHSPDAVAAALDARLPHLRQRLLLDANAIVAADPAAQGIAEVVSTYPGFYAIALHRLAHALHQAAVPRVPRLLSEYAHARTGIDIHPGAHIGPSFCIDHGTGIVVGETAVIGAHVKLFQGVTLGALSVAKHLQGIKRHPTIEDHVVIYANATILGGNTVVGSHSIIGGNVWLTDSVPSHSRVYHKAQLHVTRSEDPNADISFSI